LEEWEKDIVNFFLTNVDGKNIAEKGEDGHPGFLE
jgi:hypothetical protein